MCDLTPDVLAKLGTGDPSGCGGPLVHSGSDAGDGFTSDVVYAVDGTRVAVLLLGTPNDHALRDELRGPETTRAARA